MPHPVFLPPNQQNHTRGEIVDIPRLPTLSFANKAAFFLPIP